MTSVTFGQTTNVIFDGCSRERHLGADSVNWGECGLRQPGGCQLDESIGREQPRRRTSILFAVVCSLLKQYGFDVTIFHTEGFDIRAGKRDDFDCIGYAGCADGE